MFTGLVERTGRVVVIKEPTLESSDVWTLQVNPGLDYSREHGASVAINGTCLTEIGQAREGVLTFHVSHETLAKTSLGDLKVGNIVNLERAMRPTDRLGGHIMLGHVDGTGEITLIKEETGFWLMTVVIPKTLAKYVVSKGSIAVDGVSLTVNGIQDAPQLSELSFMLIPVTWQTTRFHTLKAGSRVNIEVDVIAKHIERLVQPWNDSKK